MTDCGCKDEKCACSWTWASAQFGAWDVQQEQMSFSAEELERMNKIFGDMDLTSPHEEDHNENMSEEDIKRLHNKFGTAEEK